MMMPSIFGENLFDDFMDFPFDDKWEKRMNKEFFGRKNPLYGKNAARLMKTDVRETDSAYELDAVSYTHLDVYKRQPISFIPGLIMVCGKPLNGEK